MAKAKKVIKAKKLTVRKPKKTARAKVETIVIPASVIDLADEESSRRIPVEIIKISFVLLMLAVFAKLYF